MKQVMRKWSVGLALAVVTASAACDSGSSNGGNDKPDAPTGLAATAQGETTVHLVWNAATGATSYQLERAAAANPGVFTQIGGALTATTYDDATGEAGASYSYRVAAVNANGTGEYSSTVSFSLAGLKERTVTGFITTDQTWYSDTTYTISGFVKVANNKTLTIQAGTTIIGDKDVAGSSLWIIQGSKIQANGTANAPIVFTSEYPAGQRKPGDWGGLIIIGKGKINRTGATPTEGPVGVNDDYSGGTDNADNSGTLRYVRIEFAGFDVNGQGQELNSLSSYAVGSGTTYEYIQALAGLDDGFEYWGGAVDGRYLISYETGDDHFDWTEGYRGRNQFLIAFQSTRLQNRAGAGGNNTDSQGFEADGCNGSNCANGANAFDSQPFSIPVWSNFTIVGPGTAVTAQASGDYGVVLRRGTGGYLTNGVIARWQQAGLTVRDAYTLTQKTSDSLRVTNVLFAEVGTGGIVAYATEAGNLAPAAAWTTSNHRIQASIAGIFTNITPGSFDWKPAAASPALTGGSTDAGGVALPAAFTANFFGGTLTGTAYVGAADPAGAAWWTGWTSYATN